METMDLPAFIRSRGLDALASRLGVSRFAVKSWLYGERLPRPETAQKIIRESRGRVTMDAIYGEQQ